MFERPDAPKDGPLYVLSGVTNPQGYRTRWKLAEDFIQRVLRSGAVLYMGEVAFGNREFVLSDLPPPHKMFRWRMTQQLWIKENVINLLAQQLPLEAKKLAWLDADTSFVRDDWADETLRQLEIFAIVQMFTQAMDFDHKHEILCRFLGFVYCWIHGCPVTQPPPPYGCQPWHEPFLWHPGLGWGFNRWAWDAIGGMLDWMILGGADYFMAVALCEQERWLPKHLGESGLRWLKNFRKRCNEHIKGDVGYVEGTILHGFHGKKEDRSYDDRGLILTAGDFDPEHDLRRDSQGLWTLDPNNKALRDGIRYYMKRRNEDAI